MTKEAKKEIPTKLQGQYLRFGKYKTMISKEEFKALEEAFLRYLQVHGTGLGFGFFLLGGSRE